MESSMKELLLGRVFRMAEPIHIIKKSFLCASQLHLQPHFEPKQHKIVKLFFHLWNVSILQLELCRQIRLLVIREFIRKCTVFNNLWLLFSSFLNHDQTQSLPMYICTYIRRLHVGTKHRTLFKRYDAINRECVMPFEVVESSCFVRNFQVLNRVPSSSIA